VNGISLGRKLIIVSYGAASQGSVYRIDGRRQHIAMQQSQVFGEQCGTEA
jgi:hypothetical protein